MTELRKNEFIEILLNSELLYEDKLKFIHCEIPTLGKITYYPKANKIQISKTNSWKENGLEFVKNILNPLFTPNANKATSNEKLRDYFAAKAIQGILSAQTEMRANGMQNNHSCNQIESLCEESYQIADAMLKQREK